MSSIYDQAVTPMFIDFMNVHRFYAVQHQYPDQAVTSMTILLTKDTLTRKNPSCLKSVTFSYDEVISRWIIILSAISISLTKTVLLRNTIQGVVAEVNISSLCAEYYMQSNTCICSNYCLSCK